ncbi:MAG: hypothetical protein O3A14_00850 [Cyanobacteria bacterium]|nr:hypothetical protein [Cyanobacteriota bacterium]
MTIPVLSGRSGASSTDRPLIARRSPPSHRFPHRRYPQGTGGARVFKGETVSTGIVFLEISSGFFHGTVTEWWGL